MINILTFDIEEWFLEKRDHGNRPEQIAQYDRFLGEILDLLDERNIKATFFCVGGMGKDFPHIVKAIDNRGHEIGCHSNIHTWLNKMTRDEASQDTHHALDALEQCIGKKIVSYRAPAFSVGEKNLWAFEVLAECGIEYDSSVFPARRDFGGFPGFGHKTPVIIKHADVTIKEFPISTTKILGSEVAYSGGGYFRFFPLWFVRHEMTRGEYAMCYFHIGDLVAEHSGLMSREEYEAYFKEKGTLIKRYKRYIKSNLGKKSAYEKLKSLLAGKQFVNLRQAGKAINWDSAPIFDSSTQS